MKSAAIALALTVTGLTWSGPAAASTVIWETSGSAVGTKGVAFDLPDSGGHYRLEFKSSIDRYIDYYSTYLFYHREYIISDYWIEIGGNEVPIYDNDAVVGKSGSYTFEIPGYTADIFGSFADVHYATGAAVAVNFSAGPLSQDDLPFTYSVRLIDLAAVPEPATWALMIAGFGATGVALRRRREPALA